jgi:hypothetical protein
MISDDENFTFWSWALPGQGVSHDESRRSWEIFKATKRADHDKLHEYVERLRVLGH